MDLNDAINDERRQLEDRLARLNRIGEANEESKWGVMDEKDTSAAGGCCVLGALLLGGAIVLTAAGGGGPAVPGLLAPLPRSPLGAVLSSVISIALVDTGALFLIFAALLVAEAFAYRLKDITRLFLERYQERFSKNHT